MKLSIVCSRFPYPIEKGDKLRMFHQIKELSKHNDIQLISLSFCEIPQKDIDKLSKYCEEVKVFYLNQLRQQLRLLANVFNDLPFQVAFFYNPYLKRNLQSAILNYEPDAIYNQLIRASEYVKAIPIPKVLDYMDAFSLNYERRIPEKSWVMRLLYKIEVKRLLGYERKVFKYFDGHTIISEQDRDALKLIEKDRIEIIRNGVDADYFKASPRYNDEQLLLFAGNMGYEPNDIAARYILDYIYPEIHKILPEVRLMIAGDRPSSSLLKYASENIIITGWMDDIREAYKKGTIFVAPLFSGSGLQNKILEAMAMELPVITTSLVNASIGIKKEKFIEANNPLEFIEGIKTLLNDSERRKEMGREGRKFVKENYTWETTTHKLQSLLKRR